MRAIAEATIGQSVHLTLFRGDKEQQVTATVAAWPNMQAADQPDARTGYRGDETSPIPA